MTSYAPYWRAVLRGLGVVAMAAMVSACSAEKPAPEADATPTLFLQVELSTNRVFVGDVFDVRILAKHPAGSTVRLPELSRSKELIVRDQPPQQSITVEDRSHTEWRLRMTSFAVGQHVLSTAAVECTTADGAVLQEPFPFAAVEVVSSLSAPDEPLRDIKDVVRWPGVVPRWIWALILVALIAALAGLAVRRFLSKPRTILRYPPPEPPHEVALRRLRALREKGWIEALNFEPFYVELSGIVRRYIEDRFRLRAPEMTTEEFIRAAAGSRHLNDEQQALTAQFLEQSDLVKFARYRPAQPDMEAAIKAAERLVVETTPAPAAQSEAHQS
ncbi:MAG: hypothetical protein BWY59_01515 [Verrucomicrobia bacterium ADurb.Bin345]|nr:MAG: hypothetical protein BWY59_01515 [Verrucomicrobia bacterium ADurb.Bin345]